MKNEDESKLKRQVRFWPLRAIDLPSPTRMTSTTDTDDDPHRLASVYLATCLSGLQYTLYFWRGEFWKWDGRRYVKKTKTDLRAEMATEVKLYFNRVASSKNPPKAPQQVSSSCLTNAIQALAGMVLVPHTETLPIWIGPSENARPFLAMNNGLLDLEALLACTGNELSPHSPRWFSQVAFPYDYIADAGCPMWLEFLRKVLEEDEQRIALLQEWFGYNLTPDTNQHKAMFLEGPGANGKSVVLEILTALLGKENVSSVPLEVFGDRFQLAMTIGKLANIVAEIGDGTKIAEGKFKEFVSGDQMYFDRKGIPGIETCPTARLTFSTNRRPHFIDRSDGIWRRILLLPFRVTIPENQQDKALAEKLKAELPGIFLWAVAGLRRLSENGGFTEPAICGVEQAQYRLESNPERVYLTEHYEFDGVSVEPTQQAYKSYEMWAKERNFYVLNESEFGKQIKVVFPAVQKKRPKGTDGKRRWVYLGLRRLEDTEETGVIVPPEDDRLFVRFPVGD